MRALKLYVNTSNLFTNKGIKVSEIEKDFLFSKDYLFFENTKKIDFEEFKGFINLIKRNSFSVENFSEGGNKVFEIMRKKNLTMLSVSKKGLEEFLEILIPYRNVLSFENKEHYLIKNKELYYIYSSNKRRKLRFEEMFLDVGSFKFEKSRVLPLFPKLSNKNSLHATYKKYFKNKLLEEIILW